MPIFLGLATIIESGERTDQCLAPIQFQRVAGNLKRMRCLGILRNRVQMENLKGATRTIRRSVPDTD
jgi:hypothetical protein